jgi:transcriptional regulator with XRE-family HTH domain
MSQAGKNLKYLRKLRGMTQEEFARKLRIKRSLLGAYEEERAEPRLEVLQLVGELYKLSLDDILLKELGGETDNYLARRRQMKLGNDSNNEIQFVPVKAAAGYLAGYADPEFIDELNTFTLPMLAPGSYRAFEIVGDSMMPTPSGSVIVAEKLENMDDIKTNNTYKVVSRNEGIVYKRVARNTRVKNKLTLISDNPAYQPYQVDATDVLEMWKASLIMSKANTSQRWDVNQLANLVNDLHSQVNQLKKKIN